MKHEFIPPAEWKKIKNAVEYLCSVPQGSTVIDVVYRLNAVFRYAERYNMKSTLNALEKLKGSRLSYGIGSAKLPDESRRSIVIKMKPLLEAVDRNFQRTTSGAPLEDEDTEHA